MSGVLIRELGGYSRLQPRLFAFSRSLTTVAQDAQDAGVQKKGRGGLIGATAVLAGASIVGGSYYAMTREPKPRVLPPVTVQSLPPAAPAPPVPTPFTPPAISARDELLQRVESLKSELEDLRKQKRDKLVDMKKKAIKDEIHTIHTGLAALDKNS